MLEIAVVDAESLGSLLDRVEGGEEILITRHGKAIARLVPNSTCEPDLAAVAAATERIRERASREGIHFDFEEFKRDRDTGRR